MRFSQQNSFHLPRKFVFEQLYALQCAFCWEPFPNKRHFASSDIDQSILFVNCRGRQGFERSGFLELKIIYAIQRGIVTFLIIIILSNPIYTPTFFKSLPKMHSTSTQWFFVCHITEQECHVCAPAAQAHYMNADLTLACERCCVKSGYLQRFVWNVNEFS